MQGTDYEVAPDPNQFEMKLPAEQPPRNPANAPPRPGPDTFAMDACRATARELVREKLTVGTVEEVAEDLLETFGYARHRDDAYELARALEDRGWTMKADIVEVLGSHHGNYEEAKNAAEKAWAAKWNIAPPLPIGSRVTVRHQFRGPESGTITGVTEHYAASYLVKMDGRPDMEAPDGPRLIVAFERALPLTAPVPA